MRLACILLLAFPVVLVVLSYLGGLPEDSVPVRSKAPLPVATVAKPTVAKPTVRKITVAKPRVTKVMLTYSDLLRMTPSEQRREEMTSAEWDASAAKRNAFAKGKILSGKGRVVDVEAWDSGTQVYLRDLDTPGKRYSWDVVVPIPETDGLKYQKGDIVAYSGTVNRLVMSSSSWDTDFYVQLAGDAVLKHLKEDSNADD